MGATNKSIARPSGRDRTASMAPLLSLRMQQARIDREEKRLILPSFEACLHEYKTNQEANKAYRSEVLDAVVRFAVITSLPDC